MTARVLINVPPRAKRGEIIEIKAMIAHPMESGFRRDQTGSAIARNIITSFECHYAGRQIFRAEFSPAIAANPFVKFFTMATASDNIYFRWTGDNGFEQVASVTIAVE